MIRRDPRSIFWRIYKSVVLMRLWRPMDMLTATAPVFRELLQNADDAGAKTVKIRFYTQEGVKGRQPEPSTLPDLKHVPVRVTAISNFDCNSLVDHEYSAQIHRYVVINDGIPFREQVRRYSRRVSEKIC